MATRDQSASYRLLRAAHHGPDQSQLQEQSQSHSENSRNIDLEANTPSLPPPEPLWVVILNSITTDTTTIKTLIRQLNHLHAQRLRVNFDESAVSAQELEIESTVNKIIELLRKSENNIKRIAMVDNPRGLNQQEIIVRKNAMRACATELQNQSRIFRHTQKEYVNALRNSKREDEMEDEKYPSRSDERDKSSSSNGKNRAAEAATDKLLDAAVDGSDLSPEQQQELVQLEADSAARMAEIVKVASSINELASLFKELNVLVIEQGTVLDRIDYNVENTVQYVNSGVVHLEKAEEYSKKGLTTKCIAVLIAIISVLLLIVIIKKSSA